MRKTFRRLKRTTTYVSVLQRALNVLGTYTERTYNVLDERQRIRQILHTSGILWLNRLNYRCILQRMPARSERIQNVLDVRQRIRQILHTFGIRWLNRQGVTGP